MTRQPLSVLGACHIVQNAIQRAPHHSICDNRRAHI
jgi:hypothetical protein